MARHDDLIKALKELTARLEAEAEAEAEVEVEVEVETRRVDSLPAHDEEFALHVAFLAVRRYAETHPRPPRVNMKQAAEMLGLSHVTVRKMIRFGTIKLNASGQIPIEQIDLVLAVRP